MTTDAKKIVERLELWFFRDLVDDQRTALFTITELCPPPKEKLSHAIQRQLLAALIERLSVNETRGVDALDPNAWVLLKRDLFFKPDAKGYTGIRDHAGHYTEEEAKSWARDGQNGITTMRLADAPEFTEACYDDLARAHLLKQRDEAVARANRAEERLSALTAPQPSPPDSWKLVPVEPTPEMYGAGGVAQFKNDLADTQVRAAVGHVYRAMIAAAPSPSSAGNGEEG